MIGELIPSDYTMNTYPGTKQLKAYADERGWTVSWGIPIQRIGNGNYTVLWKVTCTGMYPDI